MAGQGKRAQRPVLTEDVIVAAATELIEREGLDAFTMRALGRELGVSAMAVYGYFDSREALLAAVLERLMASMDTRPVPGERWDDTLRRTMTSIYRTETAHPELARIEVVPQAGETGLSEHTDKVVSMHLAQGMPEAVLTQAWAMVDAYLTGFIGNAIALQHSSAEPMRPMTAELKGMEGSGEEPPTVEPQALWRRIVADAYTDEAFAQGVEIIIQGIRGLAAPDPCEWYTPED